MTCSFDDSYHVIRHSSCRYANNNVPILTKSIVTHTRFISEQTERLNG